jgi:HAD superfamily hydrolase (TIGR01458 family)
MRADALLIDIEGTLATKDAALPGAVEAIRRIVAAGLPFRYVTNIDSVPVSVIAERLRRIGLPAGEDLVVSPAAALAVVLAQRGYSRCHLLLPSAVAEAFASFSAEDAPIECVVVGDVRDGFTYAALNTAFRYLLAGAELIAMQKGRYFIGPDGRALDTGAFVAALEYASGAEGYVIGKPSANLFRLALEELGVPAERVVVVGDDVGSDIAAAHAVGAMSILVRTGKYSDAALEAAEAKPDLVVDSIAEVPPVLCLA